MRVPNFDFSLKKKGAIPPLWVQSDECRSSQSPSARKFVQARQGGDSQALSRARRSKRQNKQIGITQLMAASEDGRWQIVEKLLKMLGIDSDACFDKITKNKDELQIKKS